MPEQLLTLRRGPETIEEHYVRGFLSAVDDEWPVVIDLAGSKIMSNGSSNRTTLLNKQADSSAIAAASIRLPSSDVLRLPTRDGSAARTEQLPSVVGEPSPVWDQRGRSVPTP